MAASSVPASRINWRDSINLGFNPAFAADYRVNLGANLFGDTRRLDQGPAGTFTATGSTNVSDCIEVN